MVRMSRNDYNRFFRKDSNGAYAGTVEQGTLEWDADRKRVVKARLADKSLQMDGREDRTKYTKEDYIFLGITAGLGAVLGVS